MAEEAAAAAAWPGLVLLHHRQTFHSAPVEKRTCRSLSLAFTLLKWPCFNGDDLHLWLLSVIRPAQV